MCTYHFSDDELEHHNEAAEEEVSYGEYEGRRAHDVVVVRPLVLSRQQPVEAAGALLARKDGGEHDCEYAQEHAAGAEGLHGHLYVERPLEREGQELQSDVRERIHQ